MLNRVQLVGRITKDPEVKVITKEGKEPVSVVNFGIAVNKPFKNASGEYEADFFNCSAFGKTAEFMGSYVKKGNLLAVSGSLTTRTYDKEQDGVKQTHYVTEVRCDSVYNYSSKSDGEAKPQTIGEIKAAWQKEWDEKSVGLDNDAKGKLKAQLHSKWQPKLDAAEAANDNPF